MKNSIEPNNIIIDTRSVRIDNKINKSFSVYTIGKVFPNVLPISFAKDI